MRAIVQERYGLEDVLDLREVEIPVPGDEQVLVQVHAAGLDRGAWHIMTGLPYVMRLGFGFRGPKQPVLGMDLAGRVAAVGANVSEWKVGDEVFGVGRGTFAEFSLADRRKLAPKPAVLSMEEAAAVPTSASTAWQGLVRIGSLEKGQRVLITGASGGVGTFAVQVARVLGAHAIGVCSAAKMDLVRSLGAEHVIDYEREDFTRTSTRYDFVLDIAGNRSLKDLRSCLAPQGTLVIVGGEQAGRRLGGIDRGLRALALDPFVRQRLRMFVASEDREYLDALAPFLEDAQVRPVVDKTFSLADAPVAMRYLIDGNVRGKVVLKVAAS